MVTCTAGSEAVLDVLEKKVDHIDEEVSLLHELKSIVLEFIRQIRKLDFEREADIKLLYEKAKDIISGSTFYQPHIFIITEGTGRYIVFDGYSLILAKFPMFFSPFLLVF